MIAIIFAGNLKYCPYLARYERLLMSSGIDFDIICWDRDGSEAAKERENLHILAFKAEEEKNPVIKTFDFLKFRAFAVQWIKERKYSKVIVLNTPTAVFLADVLKKHFRGRYIFDYRDLSYEHFKPYFWAVEQVIKNSALSVVSSKGFLEELPQHYNYLLSHNFNDQDLAASSRFERKKSSRPIVIGYFGAIRYYNHVAKFIRRVEGDPRFEFHIAGESAILDRLRDFIRQNGYVRTKIFGRYENAERSKILSGIDILFNSYCEGRNEQLAVSNKFYDGLIFKVPQIVCAGTYSHGLAEKYGVGIGLDFDDGHALEVLYGYFSNLDRDEFERNCDALLRIVREEDTVYTRRIRDFISA